jgi:catechol 2,3-dioxygenase-like lactoylglutathione lyase family enzyme
VISEKPGEAMTTPLSASFHHISLSVADLDAALPWYQQALGLEEVVERYELPEPPVRTAVLQAPNGLRVELIERAGSVRPGSADDALDATRTQGYRHWALEVDDLDQAFRDLTSAGARSLSPPAPAVKPGDRFAYVKDPEGNLLELISSRRSAPSTTGNP